MAKTKKTTKKSTNKKVSKPTKTTKTSKKSNKKEIKQTSQKQTVYEQLRLGESYISLILGAIVVFVIFVLFMFVFIKGNEGSKEIETIDVTPDASPSANPNFKTHTMQENESLWDVAVREYGDGFRYIEIIEANKDVITNPDFVPPGTQIKIPSK